MIDFHTHTFLSDGVLGPAEHFRHAQINGYRYLGISDHADFGTMAAQLEQALKAATRENELETGLTVLAGVELTHMRPQHIEEAANEARRLGAQFVVVHGETLVEPVPPGTNRAAIRAGVDILAHPGLITEEDAALAAQRNVLLEITAKGGHALANGHVAAMARRTGAKLVFNTDSHGPGGFVKRDQAERILRGASLTPEEIDALFARAERFAKHKLNQAEMDQVADW